MMVRSFSSNTITMVIASFLTVLMAGGMQTMETSVPVFSGSRSGVFRGTVREARAFSLRKSMDEMQEQSGEGDKQKQQLLDSVIDVEMAPEDGEGEEEIQTGEGQKLKAQNSKGRRTELASESEELFEFEKSYPQGPQPRLGSNILMGSTNGNFGSGFRPSSGLFYSPTLDSGHISSERMSADLQQRRRSHGFRAVLRPHSEPPRGRKSEPARGNGHIQTHSSPSSLESWIDEEMRDGDRKPSSHNRDNSNPENLNHMITSKNHNGSDSENPPDQEALQHDPPDHDLPDLDCSICLDPLKPDAGGRISRWLLSKKLQKCPKCEKQFHKQCVKKAHLDCPGLKTMETRVEEGVSNQYEVFLCPLCKQGMKKYRLEFDDSPDGDRYWFT